MNFNFEIILFYATLITGLISLFDMMFLERRRDMLESAGSEVKMPIIIEYSRSFFPVLVLVFFLRSFIYEPFRIPSASLEPTLLTGDFILVNKFDYGVRLPVAHMKIYKTGEPQRGDILVFRWPAHPAVDFIKRVIGLPGDHISYVNKELTINGTKIPQTTLQKTMVDDNEGMAEWQALEKQEDLLGVQHHIYLDETRASRDYNDIVVPAGMYFVMGDNRDDSQDSRYWGFVPEKNIVGKAVVIWMSWDSVKASQTWYKLNGIRWNRFGTVIK